MTDSCLEITYKTQHIDIIYIYNITVLHSSQKNLRNFNCLSKTEKKCFGDTISSFSNPFCYWIVVF